MLGLRPTPILKTPPTSIRYQSHCSTVTNVFLHFSCSLKHAGSIIAMAAGFGMYGKLGRLIFAGISFTPPLPSGYEGAEFYTRFVPYFWLHHVSPAVCACVHAYVRVLHTV